ncbi:MAG: C4-type zinc ribbon domain-containing protein [Tissierellaceae bacterium]|nr:C4-type zinc ribbon domain-containing protein [Tissierellaceae bacterium]
MDQLKLVWELEENNSTIDECKKSLSELEDSIRLKSLFKKSKELESNTYLIELRIIDNNKEINKLERLLKEYDYTSKKIETDLYNGSVTDIKQLDHLNKEKLGILAKIDELESSMLDMMDENEILQNSFHTMKDELEVLSSDLIEIKNSISNEIKQLQIRIQDAESQRNNIIPKIDDKILNRYEKTRVKRGKGIVSVNDNICGGCNMHIPTYLMRDLIKGDDIIYCESCGRLLYYIAP